MATYNTLTSLLTAIANAIRSKTGETGVINAQDFPSKINGIITSYKLNFYNGGGGTNFTNIDIETNNNYKKVIRGDIINSDTYDVKGSNDKITWNPIAYADLNNITYKFIKINKITSSQREAYLVITQGV